MRMTRLDQESGGERKKNKRGSKKREKLLRGGVQTGESGNLEESSPKAEGTFNCAISIVKTVKNSE